MAAKDQVDKVSMIIKNVAADEVVECWDFKVTSEPIMEGSDPNKVKSDKDLKKIQAEIRDVMRQIAATVSYLPLLECNCSFDVLIHTRENVEEPDGWGETSNVEIKDGQTVQLKTFSTGLQKVDTIVSYKMNEWVCVISKFCGTMRFSDFFHKNILHLIQILFFITPQASYKNLILRDFILVIQKKIEAIPMKE